MPLRRCVGCGRVAPKRELLRLALAERSGRSAAGAQLATRPALAVLDRACTMGGRGAYLCRGPSGGVPAADCLARATRRGAIARALRRAVRIDPEIVESVGR